MQSASFAICAGGVPWRGKLIARRFTARWGCRMMVLIYWKDGAGTEFGNSYAIQHLPGARGMTPKPNKKTISALCRLSN